MRKLPMESVTHTVVVFKAGALNADGKSGEELSLCRYHARVHQWLRGFVSCPAVPGALATGGVSGHKVVAGRAVGQRAAVVGAPVPGPVRGERRPHCTTQLTSKGLGSWWCPLIGMGTGNVVHFGCVVVPCC